MKDKCKISDEKLEIQIDNALHTRFATEHFALIIANMRPAKYRVLQSFWDGASSPRLKSWVANRLLQNKLAT